MRKKVICIIAIIFILITISIVLLLNKDNENNEYSLTDDIEVKKLYEYGDYVESMDIPPNTIVARINGEEILFHEIESYRYSINYSIENGNEESIGKSAFYEVLGNKMASYMAKKYPEASNYNLNIDMNMEKAKNEWINGFGEYTLEEARARWLKVLYIEKDEIWLNEKDWITYLQNMSVEQMLTVKGNQIISNFKFERPELVNDKILEEKIIEWNNLKERQKELNAEGKQEEMLELSSRSLKLLEEATDIYMKDLILNANLELCVDKRELSYKVPTVYSE